MLKSKNDYLKIQSKFKYFVFLLLYFLTYPLAKLICGRKNNWIICERGDDAQDNGFVFYKFLRERHKEINAYFLIKKDSPDFKKVNNLGKTIKFGSIKHFIFVIGTPVKISSHLFGYAPWVPMNKYYRRNRTKDVHVFLQHGITKNFHQGLVKDVCKSLDLFICGAKPEYDYIFKEFGYNDSTPQYTGFARFDSLTDNGVIQILLMPTWRQNLADLNNDDFIKTEYFQMWQSLMNHKEFKNFSVLNNIPVKFYIHHSFLKFLKLFSGNDFVEIVEYEKQTVQELLKESSLLITDFSSVYFDFAYMRKPVIYFQFDEENYFKNHYEKGYFDYRRDGFGDVCTDIESTIKSIKKIANNNMRLDSKYLERINGYFAYHDKCNCERIFNQIERLTNESK